MNTKKDLVKSHRLMRARDGMLSHHHRFLALAVSKLDPTKASFDPVEVSYQEYCSHIGKKLDKNHVAFYTAGRTALKRWIYIESIDEKGELEFHEWPLVREIIGKRGGLTIRFNEDLKEHFVQVKDRFSKLGLDTYFLLKRDYSTGFYEILKTKEMMAKENKFFVDITVEEIRDKFRLGTKYREYKALKQRVIIPSLNELSEKTDITYNKLEETAKTNESTGRVQVCSIRIWATRKSEKRVQQIEEKLAQEAVLDVENLPSFIPKDVAERINSMPDPTPEETKPKELTPSQQKIIEAAKEKKILTPEIEKEVKENPFFGVGKILSLLKKTNK